MLGSAIKYTSKWFTLPGSTTRERFVCRFPKTAEKDALDAALAPTFTDGLVTDRFKYASTVASAVLPLVEGYEVEGVAEVPSNWREVLPEEAAYQNVLFSIGNEIFPGASFVGDEGVAAGS